MQDRSDLLVGLVIGGLVGAMVGILLAPAPGQDTRRQVRERAGDAAELLRDGSLRLGQQASRSAQELARRIRKSDDPGELPENTLAHEAAATGDAPRTALEDRA